MRAKNMQALTEDLQKQYPGITVYGIGNAAHKLEVSDHNEDDTPGVRAEQSDSDNIPEHRAIDAMLGARFTAAEANKLVARVVLDPASKRRLHYVIWNRHIWHADHNWTQQPYSGDNPHTDHVHFSGLAANDSDGSSWPVVSSSTGPSSPHLLQKGDSGDQVRWIQNFFRDVFPAYRDTVLFRRGYNIVPDGVYGDQTVAWVKEFQRRTGLTQDGIVGPKTLEKLRQYGYKH